VRVAIWCAEEIRSLTPTAKGAAGFGMTIAAVNATAHEGKGCRAEDCGATLTLLRNSGAARLVRRRVALGWEVAFGGGRIEVRRYIYAFRVACCRMRGGANAAKKSAHREIGVPRGGDT